MVEPTQRQGCREVAEATQKRGYGVGVVLGGGVGDTTSLDRAVAVLCRGLCDIELGDVT